VPHSTQPHKEQMPTSAPESEAGVLELRRHHLLVLCSHWLNVPIFLATYVVGADFLIDGGVTAISGVGA